MTGWLLLALVALAICGLAFSAAGLKAYIRLVDPWRLESASWTGDLTQGLIVLVATFALLGLGFASGQAYAYVAAASTAGIEAVGVWVIWLIRRPRESPASTSRPSTKRALTSSNVRANSVDTETVERPIRILGIPGSHRRASYNRQLRVVSGHEEVRTRPPGSSASARALEGQALRRRANSKDAHPGGECS
jgi:hypothetical protein